MPFIIGKRCSREKGFHSSDGSLDYNCFNLKLKWRWQPCTWFPTHKRSLMQTVRLCMYLCVLGSAEPRTLCSPPVHKGLEYCPKWLVGDFFFSNPFTMSEFSVIVQRTRSRKSSSDEKIKMSCRWRGWWQGFLNPLQVREFPGYCSQDKKSTSFPLSRSLPDHFKVQFAYTPPNCIFPSSLQVGSQEKGDWQTALSG